jgi:hypothetical protein
MQVLRLQFNNFNLIASHFNEYLPKCNELIKRYYSLAKNSTDNNLISEINSKTEFVS